MTRWVNSEKLNVAVRERLKNGVAFLPTLTLGENTGLPEMAITEAVFDEWSEEYLGREYLDVYPRGYCMPGESWAGPNLALKYAFLYYNEGLSYDSPEFEEGRLNCFKAAEVLFLHAAVVPEWEGSAKAWCMLGRLYYYDRCLGDYWLLDTTKELLETYPDVLWLRDRGARAYYSLKKAIALGDPEAIYILGDCYREGLGCTMDTDEAARLYRLSYAKSSAAQCFVKGSSALRVARAFEFGEGEEQNFEVAMRYYQIAYDSLTRALNLGEDIYEEECIWAEKGLERTKQEVLDEGDPWGFSFSNRPRRYCD